MSCASASPEPMAGFRSSRAMRLRSARSRRILVAGAMWLGCLAIVGADQPKRGMLDPYATALVQIDSLAHVSSSAADSADILARSMIAGVRAQFGPMSRQEYGLVDSLTSIFSTGSSRSLALSYGDSLLAIAPSFIDPRGTEMARVYSRHAKLRYESGDPQGAVEDGRHALAIARAVPDLPGPALADYHEELAGLCVGAWMYDSARVALGPCLEIRRATAGERSLTYARTLSSLASMEWHAGDYTAALEAVEKAIETAEAAAPGRGWEYTRLYNLHAAILGDLQDNQRANALFRKCVRLALGKLDWKNAARYMNNVGLSETVLGHYDQARAYHDSAFTIRMRI